MTHGFVQGTLNEAMGGDFRGGFLGGAASSLGGGMVPNDGNMAVHAIAGAVIGGTASALGGDKFANGAASGAFVALFNDALGKADKGGDKRKKLVKFATESLGDEDYALAVTRDGFGPKDWKCNLWVHDALVAAGITPPMMPGGRWPLMANSWADKGHKIPGWIIVDTPEPGDVAAIPRSGDSGHVGIYIKSRLGSDVIAANKMSVDWSRSHLWNESFATRPLAGASGPTVYRRYVGR